MVVLWTFRAPALCRRMHRAFMRNTLLDYTPIIPATAFHQSSYVETYSRYNSAASTLDTAVETVRKTIDSIPAIHEALAAAANEDIAENSIRHICENGFVKLVSSFQRFAEAQFDLLPHRSQFNPRRNVFQNLTESSDLWRSAISDGYEDMLTTSELSHLECFFQQRHLLAHKEGMVDQAYIDKSGDHRYAVGQRLVIRQDVVLNLADLVSKLAEELRRRT
jgi:hypothetical protein